MPFLVFLEFDAALIALVSCFAIFVATAVFERSLFSFSVPPPFVFFVSSLVSNLSVVHVRLRVFQFAPNFQTELTIC